MILFNNTFTPGLPDWDAAAVAFVFFVLLPAVVHGCALWRQARRAEAGPDPLAGYVWMQLGGPAKDAPVPVGEVRR